MIYADTEMLSGALKTIIRRINETFKEKWLYIGSVVTTGSFPDTGIEIKPDVNNYRIKPNSHDFTEICMCIEGALSFEVGDELIRIDEGQVIILLPGVPHLEIPIKKQDYKSLWFVVHGSKARLHLSGAKNNEFFTSTLSFLKQSQDYYELVDNIKHEAQYFSSYYYTLAKTYLLQVCITALREITTKETTSAEYASWKEYVASEIKEYITSKGPGHIKLNEISQDICISENHMNNLFKSVTGLTVTQYMEQQRIERAKQLLRDPNLTIDSISGQLGYYDRYHFGKSFKKATGISPGRFRKLKH